MFTGNHQGTGHSRSDRQRGGDVRLSIQSDGLPWTQLRCRREHCRERCLPDSHCVARRRFRHRCFDGDTGRDVAAAICAWVRSVNLEPSLSLGERLGGHLVSGHVDCLGRCDVEPYRCALDPTLVSKFRRTIARYVARKGSVCIDGVSLTINEVSDNRFELEYHPAYGRD